MGNKWRKIKLLLGMNVCAVAPPDPSDLVQEQHSQANTDPQLNISTPVILSTHSAPTTPNHSAPSTVNSGRRSLRLSRSTCSICLGSMKPGQGHALFTAECSHTFHFSCIASNVRHSNLVCPVCRAKWTEVPWQAPMEGSKSDRGRSRSQTSRGFPSIQRSSSTQIGLPSEEQQRLDPLLHTLDESNSQGQWHQNPRPMSAEPNFFNDDEPLMQLSKGDSNNIFEENNRREGPSSTSCGADMNIQASVSVHANGRTLDLKLFPEVFAVPAMESRDSFSLVVHVKAPLASITPYRSRESVECDDNLVNSTCRAPLDLVTVLDVSGSMAGTKLVLLKRAMDFVIRNLSPADRLSVVVFSSSARRVFPLRKMVEGGRQQAIRIINALDSSGGTNIAEGLRKGAKVLEDRRNRNHVAAMILLSDGQDTYSMSTRRQLPFLVTTDSRRLVPSSIRHSARHGHTQIPVHTFGFGSDHDAATMHAISEASGGTFSFIQAEWVMQDAFAQCIGGLLSVVVQDVQLRVSCSAPGVLINRIHAGSYDTEIVDDAQHGVIKLGDLYAEEERDVLVEIKLPEAEYATSMSLVHAGCIYKNSMRGVRDQEVVDQLFIMRPESIEEGQQVPSLDVDRQRNRFRVAEAISKARALADQGYISAAQCKLQSAKDALENSSSALAGEQLCHALGAELSEIMSRMVNQHVYESTGRAYLLSAQSCHLRQRATTRGESLESRTLDYQTPSMADMVMYSQTLSLSSKSLAHSNTNAARSPGARDKTNASSSPFSNFLSRRPSTKVSSSHGSTFS